MNTMGEVASATVHFLPCKAQPSNIIHVGSAPEASNRASGWWYIGSLLIVFIDQRHIPGTGDERELMEINYYVTSAQDDMNW